MINTGNNMHWATVDVFTKNDHKVVGVVGQNCLMRLKNEDWNGSNYVLFYIAVEHMYNPYNKIMSNEEYLQWYIEFLSSIGFKCYYEGIRVVKTYRNETFKPGDSQADINCYAIKIDQADFKNRYTFFATWQSIRYIYSYFNTKTVKTIYMLQKRFGEYLDNSVIYQIAHYIIPRKDVNNTWTVLPRISFCHLDYNGPKNSWGDYPSVAKEFVSRLKTKEIFQKDTTISDLPTVQQMFNYFNGDNKMHRKEIDAKHNQYYSFQAGILAEEVGEEVRQLLIKIGKCTRDRAEWLNQILELLAYPGPSIEMPKVRKVRSKSKVKDEQIV